MDVRNSLDIVDIQILTTNIHMRERERETGRERESLRVGDHSGRIWRREIHQEPSNGVPIDR